MSALPPGFTLDEESDGLPKGFKLDERRASAKPKEGWDAVGDKLSRFGSGMFDPVVGAAQIADRFLVDPIRQAVSPGASSMKDYVRARDAEYEAPEGVDWMRTAGNVANPISWAGGGAGTMGQMAASGAFQAALAPTAADDSLDAFIGKKAGQAALGGALGAVANKLTRGLAKATPEAEALMQQGVRVPPGAAIGGKAAEMEQRLTSLPLAGDVIKSAQRRAQEDVQRAAIKRATGFAGSVDDANRAVSNAYRQSVPHIPANPGGLFDAADAYNAALKNPELIPSHREMLTGLWDKHFANYQDLGGEGLKKLDSELGALGRKYSGFSSPASDRTLADELYNIQQAMRAGWKQGMADEPAALLDRANAAYRQMVPINKAASTRADKVATPRALQKAMARANRTDVTRMAHDPLIDNATDVLTATVPDSGSAGRIGAMAALAHPVTLLKSIGATVPMMAAYTEGGTNALLGRADWQRLIAPYSDQATQALIAALRE